MKGRNPLSTKAFHFQAHKTVSAGEILAAGGATAYAKKVGENAQKVFLLSGESISDEELNRALSDLAVK